MQMKQVWANKNSVVLSGREDAGPEVKANAEQQDHIFCGSIEPNSYLQPDLTLQSTQSSTVEIQLRPETCVATH